MIEKEHNDEKNIEKNSGIKRLINKETIMYLIFGVLTTLIYLVSYNVFANIFDDPDSTTTLPTVIAWIIAVLFAYITNKIFVFESKIKGFKGLTKEFLSFIGARLATLLFSIVWMWFFVDKLHLDIWTDELGQNLFANNFLSFVLINKFGENIWNFGNQFFVMIFNYLLSKIFVFEKEKK